MRSSRLFDELFPNFFFYLVCSNVHCSCAENIHRLDCSLRTARSKRYKHSRFGWDSLCLMQILQFAHLFFGLVVRIFSSYLFILGTNPARSHFFASSTELFRTISFLPTLHVSFSILYLVLTFRRHHYFATPYFNILREQKGSTPSLYVPLLAVRAFPFHSSAPKFTMLYIAKVIQCAWR